MAEYNTLEAVKNGLGLAGNDTFNETLDIYITEVKEFMKGAGVSEETVNAQAAAGVITRGVADLWNYGSGSVGLSDYFKMRVTQLALNETRETNAL